MQVKHIYIVQVEGRYTTMYQTILDTFYLNSGNFLLKVSPEFALEVQRASEFPDEPVNDKNFNNVRISTSKNRSETGEGF